MSSTICPNYINGKCIYIEWDAWDKLTSLKIEKFTKMKIEINELIENVCKGSYSTTCLIFKLSRIVNKFMELQKELNEF